MAPRARPAGSSRGGAPPTPRRPVGCSSVRCTSPAAHHVAQPRNGDNQVYLWLCERHLQAYEEQLLEEKWASPVRVLLARARDLLAS